MKAFEYSYELHLDRETVNKTVQEEIKLDSIKKTSLKLKKSHYQSVHQGYRKAHPTNFDMQKDNLKDSDLLEKLFFLKDDLLMKKKEFYQREDTIKLLSAK